MADGKTHLRVALVADAWLMYAAWHLNSMGYPDQATGVVVGAVLGTLITPDYDIQGSTITEAIIRKTLPLVGDFWVADWFLYSLWSKHRGISHIFVIGTLTRMVYLLWRCWWWYVFAAGLIYLYMAENADWLVIGLEPSAALIWTAFTTWCIHDGLHLIFDRKEKKKHVNIKRYTGK